ncbi:ribosome maturation factor RimM [Nesterenkonia sp.]|uniref:ribosome maturation factor RimM n=1 Tax=Nesterenkonia sp. TaxID=704201 RepID=UPI00262DF0B1|nr:ribosome maturation factor RimM [Nesterenkonia sp.]
MAASEYGNGPQARPDHGERLRVARIGKPHGIRGEVTVQLFTDEPAERLAPGSQLIREPGRDTQDRTTSVLTVSRQRWNKQICLLGFDEIADRSAAEALRGSVLYIDVSSDQEDEEGWYSHELEGMVCVDAAGRKLGVVAELITGPAQDLLVVTTEAGEEVLVPFVEAIVPHIDPGSRQIRLTPPEGLFP